MTDDADDLQESGRVDKGPLLGSTKSGRVDKGPMCFRASFPGAAPFIFLVLFWERAHELVFCFCV